MKRTLTAMQEQERRNHYCLICRDVMLYPCTFECHRHTACIPCAIKILEKNARLDVYSGDVSFKDYKCPFCKCMESGSEGFYPLSDLAYELFEHDVSFNLPIDLQCLFCDSIHDTLGELCGHMCRCANRPIHCPSCNQMITYEKLYSPTHWHTECTGVKCRMCNRTDTLSNIRQHESNHDLMQSVSMSLSGLSDLLGITSPSDEAEFVQALEQISSILPVMTRVENVDSILIGLGNYLERWNHSNAN